MRHSFLPTNRKDQERTRQDSTDQRSMAFFGHVRGPIEADTEFIRRASWDGCMRYAVQRSGMDDYEVADEMHMSHGNISKILKGTAGLWGQRLVTFMRVTESIAPLQWLAEQMGYELRQKAPNQRIAELEAELERERSKQQRSA